MKTILDYLKENKKFEGIIGHVNLRLKLFEDILVVSRDTYIHTCKVSHYSEAEEFIEDILADHKVEVRFCEECGKPIDNGYIAGGGEWYCCEDCFKPAMDRDYGQGKWRGTDEEGVYGGYYEYIEYEDDDEWIDTGIFYTEWNS